MAITGTVVNGAIVPDEGGRLREGAKYYLEPVEGDLPPDHPMAPYDREREIAIIRASILDEEPGVPIGRSLKNSPANTASDRYRRSEQLRRRWIVITDQKTRDRDRIRYYSHILRLPGADMQLY